MQKTCNDLSFTQLIGPCQRSVYRVALRITRNREDAEDTQQETLLKVHRKLVQFEGRSRFTTWIHRIAINEALMCLRKRRGASHVPLKEAIPPVEDAVAEEDFHSPIEGPEAAYSRKELRNLLTRAIENLNPIYRTVFLLRAVEQFSTSETANVLELSSSTVKTRMRRARSKLRDYLQQSGTNHSHEIPNGQPAIRSMSTATTKRLVRPMVLAGLFVILNWGYEPSMRPVRPSRGNVSFYGAPQFIVPCNNSIVASNPSQP